MESTGGAFFKRGEEGQKAAEEAGSAKRVREKLRGQRIKESKERRRQKEPKPKLGVDPLLRRLLKGDPTAIAEMPEDINRDTECAMEVEMMLNELKPRCRNRRTCLPSGGISVLDIFAKSRSKSFWRRPSMIDIIEFVRFLGNAARGKFLFFRTSP